MKYKANKTEIRDDEGYQILVVLPSHCTKKRARMLTARLAEVMNAEENRLNETKSLTELGVR